MNSKLILGTAQFGLNYGINNLSGKPSEKEVFEILDIAYENKIGSLDTADVYGDAMEQIGRYHNQRSHRFNVLSKFKDVKEGEVSQHVECSLNKLQTLYFEVYSYHAFFNYVNHAYLKDELQDLKRRGLIKKIGISVYSNDEFSRVVEDEHIDVIQIPYNLLDNQNIRGLLIEQAKRKEKEIHIRSVFLQGLLLMDKQSIPEKLVPLNSYIQKIALFCEKEKIDLQALALSYAFHNKEINRILIGVDTKDQLLANLTSIGDFNIAFDYINQQIKVKETNLLNPVNW